jgi:hypothetical protein
LAGKGRFTGRNSVNQAVLIADGGTLLLDEIGDMPLEIQAKLLRVLQDGTFERLGSNRTLQADVRIVAATNKDICLRQSRNSVSGLTCSIVFMSLRCTCHPCASAVKTFPAGGAFPAQICPAKRQTDHGYCAAGAPALTGIPLARQCA